MTLKKLILWITIVLTLVVVSVLWLDGPQTKSRTKNVDIKSSLLLTSPPITATDQTTEPSPPPSNPMQALLQTPITFYGLVMDQNQNPVPQATISASVLNNLASGSPISTTSDTNGRFIIQTNGASLQVRVSKSGYYDIDRGDQLKPSSQSFDFAADTGRGVHQAQADNPTVLHLRKADHPVLLKRINGQAKLPRNGRAVVINLDRENTTTLTIQCTTEAHSDDSLAPFSWRCEIHVPGGGGIQEVGESNTYEAPEHGYVNFAVIDMPKSLGLQEWRDAEIKNYWIRFEDNTFAKVRFRMIAGGDHFAVLDGFKNPLPNDRNLEPKLDVR